MMLARPEALEDRRAREARAWAIHGELIAAGGFAAVFEQSGFAAERTSLGGMRWQRSDN